MGIVDVHVHYMKSDGIEPREFLLRKAGDIGIDIMFLLPYEAIYRRNVLEDSLRVIKMFKSYPNRVVPFVSVDPWDERCREQLELFIAMGAKGLKIHPLTQGIPAHSELLYPLIELAERNRLLVLVHTGSPIYSQPLQVLELALTFTHTFFILAHMGLGILWYDSIRAAKRADNIYLDTAGQRFLPVIEYAVRELGSERILFGSDMPFLSIEVELEKIRHLRVSEHDKENILYRNAKYLLSKIRGDTYYEG
ncbi:MAG: amidohydrolase family protein [Ignisphaera sp.]